MESLFDTALVKVGDFSYGGIRVVGGTGPSSLNIGSFCSIAEDVTFVLNGDHPIDRPLTFPLRTFLLGLPESGTTRGDIVIGDDVWIGHGALVMSGVNISRGSVVAAGALVTKDIPPYAVVAGVPARLIKYRFPPEVIERLASIDLEKIDAATLRRYGHALESTVSPATLVELEEMSINCANSEGFPHGAPDDERDTL